MPKSVKYSYSCLAFMVLVLFLSIESEAQPFAENGILDLSAIDFVNQQAIELNGEWGFYWKELVAPAKVDSSPPPDYVQFPYLWSNDPGLSSFGYATYTLQVIKPKNHPRLALSIPDLYTAYTLYLNNEVISKNGTVGTTPEQHTPFWLPATVTLTSQQTDTLQFVLHVSNFEHSKGGIRLPIILGTQQYLQRERTIEIGFIMLLTGCLFMIGLFFLGLYMFGRHEVPMLYFAFICFCYSYRVVGSELYPLHYLFPELPWILTTKAEYFSLYFTATLFCIFVKKLYPREVSNSIINGFTGFFGLLSLVALLFPAFIFTELINLFFLGIPFLIVYLTWVYIKGVINKREGARFALASTVMVFVVFSHNLLEYVTVLEENLVLNFVGLFSFFFLQSLILSYRFTNSLSKARIKAEEAAHAKSQFLSTMSHEIRTPLNAVIGLSELLIDTKSKTETHEFAKNIKESGENLLEIINNILDYSKLESTSIEAKNEPVHLETTVNEIIRLLHPLSKDKNLKIETQIATDVPEWITTDSTRLKQILINLIGNAIKFTEAGRISVLVEQNETPSVPGNIKFIISDTGSGISDKDIHRLFKSFSQVDVGPTRKHGGTGLGLVISKKLVEILGGQIWFESEVGQGTVFHFTLNAPAAKAPTLPEPDALPAFELPKEFNKKYKVLVVEDNLMNQKVILKILEKNHLTADIAENGKHAFDMLRNQSYDLVFMDMEMPVMDGIEATKIIRKSLPEENQPVIIAMTANAFDDDRRRCLDAGMNDFISKPVSVSIVAAKLKEWMG